MPSVLEPSRPDQACTGIAFCFLYSDLNIFREQRTDVQIPNIRPCVSSSASGCRTFPTTKKSSVSLALRNKQYPYLLSKQCLHPRSKTYPTNSVNCACIYGASSTRTYSVNSTCTYSPFGRFSVCATHVFELMKRRM